METVRTNSARSMVTISDAQIDSLKGVDSCVAKFSCNQRSNSRKAQAKPYYNKRIEEDTTDKAGVVLIVQGGKDHEKVLLVKGKDYGNNKGKWGLPKGSIKENETPYNAAVREMEEETGIIVSGKYLEFSNTVFGEKKYYFIFIIPYFAIMPIKIQEEEIKECNYVDWKAFGDDYENMNSFTKGFIRHFYNKVQVSLLCKSSTATLQDVSQHSVASEVYQQANILDLELKAQNGKQLEEDVIDVYQQFGPIFEQEEEVFTFHSLESILEEDEPLSSSSSCEDLLSLENTSNCCVEFPAGLDYQYTGYGVFVNDHMWGRGFIKGLHHTHGCSEYCSLCYPMNSSVFENADVGIIEKSQEREAFDFYDICYCDNYMLTCANHYNDYSTESSTTTQYSAQMNNYSRMQINEAQELLEQFKNVQIRNIKPKKNIVVRYNTCSEGKINIVNLKQYFKVLRHGDKRQVLSKLIKYVQDDFTKTHQHNSEKHYKWLCDQYKFYSIKCNVGVYNRKKRDEKYKSISEQYSAQMFKSLTEAIKSPFNMYKDARDTISIVKDVSEKVDAVMDYIPALTGSLVAFTKGLGAGIAKVFIQLFSAFYLISQPCNQNPANITAILVSSLTGIVPVNDLIDRLILAAKTLFTRTTQMGNLNFVGCLVDVIVGTIKSCFGAMDSVAVADFSVKAKFVQTVTKACSNIKNLVDTLTYVMGEVLSYFGDFLVRYYGYVPGFMRDRSVLDNLIRDYRRFEELDLTTKARTDMGEANFVNGLYIRLIEAEEKYLMKVSIRDKSAKNISILPYIRSMKAKVKEAIDVLPPTFRTIGGGGRRSKPFWIAINGEPRIGKSTWLQHFLATQLAKDCRLINDYQDPSTYSFTRTCGQEFWDGYCGQPILIYDDLFQVYAHNETVYNGIDEITKVVNDAIYQLNMSSINQKSNTYCTSKIVISNMQKDIVGKTFLTDKCLSDGEHIFTRRNVVMDLKLDNSYKTMSGVIDQDKFRDKIQELKRDNYEGTSKIYEVIPEGAYTITFTNPKTGAPLGVEYNGALITDLPVDFAIDCVRLWCRDHFAHTSAIGQKIEDVARSMFNDAPEYAYASLFSNTSTNLRNLADGSPPLVIPRDITREEMRKLRTAQNEEDNCNTASNNISNQSSSVMSKNGVKTMTFNNRYKAQVGEPSAIPETIIEENEDEGELDEGEQQDNEDQRENEEEFHSAIEVAPPLTSRYAVQCPETTCGWVFYENEDFYEHLSIHGVHIRCEVCQQQMHNYTSYFRHLVRNHNADEARLFRVFSIRHVNKEMLTIADVEDTYVAQEIAKVVQERGYYSDQEKDALRARLMRGSKITGFSVIEKLHTTLPPHSPVSMVDYFVNHGTPLPVTLLYPYILPIVTEDDMNLAQYLDYIKTTDIPPRRQYAGISSRITCGCEMYFNRDIVPFFTSEVYRVAEYISDPTHECCETHELLQRRPMLKRSYLSEMTSKCWQTICAAYDAFEMNPIMTLFGIAGAILSIVAGIRYMRSKPEENLETQHKGSNGGNNRAKKSERQRARNNEYKRSKNNKGVNTIHEIDRKEVVIGQERNAQVYTNSNLDVEKLLDGAIGRASIVIKHDSKILDTDSHVSFVNVYGSIIALPQHFMLRCEQFNDLYKRIGLNAQVNVKFDFDETRKNTLVDYNEIKWMKPSEELEYGPHLVDVAFCYIKGLIMGRDISKHFNSIKDDINLTGCYLYGLRSKTANPKVVPSLLTVANTCLFQRDIETETLECVDYNLEEAIDDISKQVLNKKVISIPWFYTYRSNTIPGDCGMMLMHTDHNVSGKILGFHVAGATRVQEGVSIPIYKEDINDVVEWFREKYPQEKIITKSGTLGYELRKESHNTEFAAQILSTGIRSVGYVQSMHIAGRDVHVSPHITGNSNIKESMVYDELVKQLGQPTSHPARLKPFINEKGERVSPFVKGIEKMQTHSQRIPEFEVNEIVQHCISSIVSWNSVHMQDMRVLTDDETLNGYDGLKQVDITTSPGVPFKTMTNKTGKNGFFTKEILEKAKERYSLTKEMEDILLAREEDAKEGVISPTLFVDSLKDETRSMEKVLEGKTRIFQCGPLDLLLLTRKYCGKFISHCHNTYVDGEMAIGVAPYSDAWHDMLRRMFVFSKFLNGDYKNYDSSLSLQIGCMIADIINGCYNDSWENQLVRFCLIVACFCCEHLAYDIIYVVLQSNPSGCSLTSIINGIANMIVTRLVFKRSTGLPLSEFEKHVIAKFFGDDNLIGISDAISNLMTMANFASVCASIGMTYTTSDKSEIRKPYYEHGEISFLTNDIKFVKQLDGFPINKYLALLDKETINDIPYWSHGDPSNVKDQMNRFNMALFFSRNHGKDYFDYLRKAYVNCLHYIRRQLHYNIEGALFTWENVMILQTPEYKTYLDVRNLTFRPVKLPFQDITGNTEVGKIGPDGLPYGVIEDHNTYASNFQEYIENISAQMSTKKIKYSAQMENDNTLTEQITKFDENEKTTIGLGEERLTKEETSYKTDLESFLMRPFNLGTFAWTSALNLNSIIATLALPVALTNLTTVREKLNKFTFWRPSFEITIRVNGTPMHYGRLVAWWMPQASGLSDSYKFSRSATTFQWVQIDANGSNVATIHIPYTHYADYMTIGKVDDDLATIYIAVAAPLNIIGDVAPSINFTVFCRMTEVNLSGFTYANNYVAQSGNVQKIIHHMPKYYEIETDGTVVNGAINAEESAMRDVLVNASPLEKTINGFCKRPSLIYTGTITSLAAGIIFSTPITPSTMMIEDYINSGLVTTDQFLTPMAYMARNFAFWRGSMKFHISFICSNFHNMRVRVIYNPYVNSTGSVYLPDNEFESDDLESIILDLSNQKELSFEIPYQQITPWSNSQFYQRYGYPANEYRGTTNGVWALQILNGLTSGVSPVTPIYYQIFVQAGDDLEFARPSARLRRAMGYVAQVGTNTVTSAGNLTFSASDMETLSNSSTQLIGRRKVIPLKTNNVTTSVKTIKEFSTILSDLGFWDKSTYYWNPNIPQRIRSEPFRSNGRSAYSILYTLMTVFRYYRGGIRVTLLPPNRNNSYVVEAYSNIPPANLPVEVTSDTFTSTDWSASQSLMYSNDVAVTPLDFVAPYNSRYNCITSALSTMGTESNYGLGSTSIAFHAMTDDDTIIKHIFIAGADDFIFGYQLGIPKISITAPPL